MSEPPRTGTLPAHLTSAADGRIPAPPLEGEWPVVEVEDLPAARPPAATRGSSARSSTTLTERSDRRSNRPGPIRQAAVPVIVVAGVIAALLIVVGVILTQANWMRDGSWTIRYAMLVIGRWLGNVLAVGVGLWWWRRAPANPTGRLLYLAGVCDCLFIIGNCWPDSAWATQLTWFGTPELPLVSWIVLGWPTGRPSRVIKRAVLAQAAGVALIFLVGGLFQKSEIPDPHWPDQPLAFFTVPEVWKILDPIQALLLTGVPAIAAIILLVRRHRSVPPAVRPLITPITVAGVLVAASLVVLHFGYQVFGELLQEPVNAQIGVTRLLILLPIYSNLAFVAIGVWVGALRRQRAVAVGARELLVDLRSASPVISPSAAAAAAVGDPSSTVRYRAAAGSWIDASGQPLDPPGPGRRLIPVLDDGGELTAALEVDVSTPIPPLLADLVVSVIAARAANERAAALADARRREVAELATDLVLAADAGRQELERTLHDGAQQLLVGLALTAGLAARRGTAPGATGPGEPRQPPDPPAAIIEQIDQVRREILALVDASSPAALAGGLAGGLRSLATVSPISTSVKVSGDLVGTDGLARGLYLATGEAITNAIKHARAERIAIELSVDDERVRIRVQDNGIGGVSEAPTSLAGRLAELHGTVRIDSPVGVGTTVHLQVRRQVVPGSER